MNRISFPPEPKCKYCKQRGITVTLHRGRGFFHNECWEKWLESLCRVHDDDCPDPRWKRTVAMRHLWGK